MPIQAKVGWRAYVSPVTASYLLDSYSGATAAYSLRKLRTTYSGPAIRVRRSSDNTELNIGFDANGDLDTYSLSGFVGTGNGFVTTWYDQSGNGNNATQTTASSQPQIVSDGSILTTNGKPSIKLDGVDDEFVLNSSISSNVSTYQSFVGKRASSGDRLYALSNNAGNGYIFGLWNTNEYVLQGKTNFYQISSSTDTTTSQLLLTGKVSSGIMSMFKNGNIIPSTQSAGTISPFINSIGKYFSSLYPTKCSLQEIVFYNNDQTSNQTGIESNINAHYSIYSNVSSLLTSLYSVYNADATGSSSLKTSLYAAYNGESNTNDSFGSNNGTAVGGLTYTTGKIGNAFTFNGTNAYVSLPNSSGQFNFTGDFSVSMWFKSSNLSTSRYAIGNYKAGGSYGYGWVLYYTGAGGFAFDVRNNNNINQVTKLLPLLTNTWYHVVAVRKMGQTHKLYVNGVDQSVTQTEGNVNNLAGYTANQPMNLGGLPDINLPALCDLDGVNIWQKELTQSEITELYNSGNGAQYIGDNFYKPTPNDALNTYNGTAQGGLTYEVGKVGTAFKFNGTNAFINLGDVMDLGLSSWSYGMWFKSNVASAGTLFSKTIAAGLAGRFAAYIDSNRINFLFDPNYSNPLNIGTSNTILTNTWYHLVCVFDRTSNIRLYLNGVLQSVTISYGLNDLSQFGAANTNYNTSCLFRIGAYTAADNINALSLFNGSIDAFNVWNRVLTESEINELYNSGNGKQYPY